MGHMRGKLVDAGLGSPLDVAITQRDRGTLAMVRQALERGDAALAYQPVMRADGAGVAFYEGLIRVLDDTGRVIPARDFIGVVEDQDLGRQIDCVALKLGLSALRAHPTLRLSINMSARSVGYPDWMQVLRRAIRQWPEIVHRLILEITETSAMQMPEIVKIFMEDLQDKGIVFALDDFGAGQTAFRHLRHFCFDIVKIDGAFARNVSADADNQVLYEALISLARHFDMLVVAEAVETEEEARWLTAAGVDCLQGYHYGAPTFRPPWAPEGKRAALPP
ncbi:EAL domain-containing protein [Roseicyclus mahoneyensis]|uniref:EAL domain-containing protein (Putative c-di-GMP-specific phosphodiesterase class I) n=1 Tax=Roseicyclus mahoneyensis TaxID=164332 RepID=A0A316GH76_9RHOB|nr:EAL domain-containing protein (putative c-di-GMP-specific phosphodiesterase class I) [Roseicyclus mahoneyensis]